jgi:hypothetical protein
MAGLKRLLFGLNIALATIVIACAFLAMTATMPPAADDAALPRNPRVVGISGRCIALPNRALTIGSELAPGQKFRFSYPRQSTDYIDILMPNGQVYTVDCTGWLTCFWSQRVPTSATDDERASDALGAMKDMLFPREDQNFDFTNVRGDSRTGEMVLKSVEGRVDVSPMMFTAPPGAYTLSFAPHPASAVTAPAQTFALTVPVVDPDQTRLGPIQPGLYAVTIAGPLSKLYWILVTDAAGYGAAQTSLRNAKALTDTWSDQVKDQSVHNFLRAYLVSLARGHGSR